MSESGVIERHAGTAEAWAHPSLRESVLGGRYFGQKHRDVAERLAAFLAEPDSGLPALFHWFGPETMARLAADPERWRTALDRDIADIDALIGVQLDAVLHAPRLQRLEGSWRGLRWLVAGIEPGTKTKTKVLNVSWAELCRDLERAPEFDQSQTFRRVYEDEFGTPGGEPFGLLVIDHEVRHRPGPGAPTDDVTALASLSAVAAAAFAPTVLSASPALLAVDGFEELATVADPAAAFRSAEYDRWRGLSRREDIRFVAIALPRMLAREPWGDDPGRADGFRYREAAPDVRARVWTSAGFGFAAVVARAFATYGWPADVRGVEIDRLGGGVVGGITVEPFHTDPDHVWTRPPLDVVLTDRQERSLVDAGLMPLSALPFSEEAVFGSVGSLQTPPRFIGRTAAAADANARLSAQIGAMLCVSRFAHALKLLGREMVGAFLTSDDIERRLQGWLTELRQRQHLAGSRAAGPLSAGRRQRRGAGAARQARGLRLRHPFAAAVSARRTCGHIPPGHRIDGARDETLAEEIMSEAQETAGALFRAGKLAPAIDQANLAVRKAPGDLGARVLLAELLVLSGNLERADVILDAASEAEPSAAVVVAEFRQLIRADMARRQLRRDGRIPEFLGEPTPSMRETLAALVALRAGDVAAAGQRANEAELLRPRAAGRAGETAFDDFRDIDDLCAGFFEVLTTTGKYYWIPTERVASVEFEPPRRPRDLVWRRASMSVREGPDGVVYLPAIYGNDDPDLADDYRLGRATDWRQDDDGPVRGIGQRVFLVGEEDCGIMDLGALTFGE